MVASASRCESIDPVEVDIVLTVSFRSESSCGGCKEAGGGFKVLICSSGQGDGSFVVSHDVEIFV